MYVLSFLTWLPLIGGMGILLTPREQTRAIRAIAVLTSGAAFAVSLWLWSQFNGASAEFQFVEKFAWIPA